MKTLLLLFCSICFFTLQAQTVRVDCRALTGDYGGLQLAPVYSDRMVLQRDKPLRIQGIANAGEPVTLTIGNQKKETVTGADGKWTILLDPLSTGQSYTMKVASPSRELRYEEILAGEVWLCSGQSNMAFEVRESVKAEVEEVLTYAAKEPMIRFYDMKPLWQTNAVEWDKGVMDSLNTLHYFKETSWQSCNATNAAGFSAIAFAFARMLTDSLRVPVGLIVNAVGGSPTEAWIDRKSLEFHFPDILTDWTKNDFIQPWVRERAMLNIRQSTDKGQRHPYEPVYLFESGIQPLQHYSVRGILWYQGESNAHNVEAHEKLFPLLVKSWRRYWSEELPFYYVQLSGINRPSWPWFRDSQRRMMKDLPAMGMAVSSDRGDSLDVHPRYKKDIGERLARWALADTYNRQIIPSGPLVEKAVRDGDTVKVYFTYNKGLTTSDKEAIRTFEVAETDGLYYPAQAVVENDILIIRSDSIEHPRYVRYGWQPYTKANLINKEGLPASTFQIEIENLKDTLMKWSKLPDLPGTETTASLGVSAPFAAVIENNLIVAGGCNFPDKPVTEGGIKRYYDEVFTLDLSPGSSAVWKIAGHLPYPVAYGATAITPDGMVCIGGNNNEQAFTNVLLLALNDQQQLTQTPLPALPVPLDNPAATAIGQTLYVTGGNANGKPSNALYCLDLNNPSKGWKRLKDFPGPARLQPVLVAQHNGKEQVLYLAGGFQPVKGNKAAQVPVELLTYSPSRNTWAKESSLPAFPDGTSRTLTGGGGVAYGDQALLFTGGVNYNRFLAAIDRPRQIEDAKKNNDTQRLNTLQAEAAEYMFHPVEWYNFNKDLLIYNTLTKEWRTEGAFEPLARAGAGVAIYKDQLIIVNGELKPGIRTPQVSGLNLLEE